MKEEEKARRAALDKEAALEGEATRLGLPRLIAIRGEVRPRAVLVAPRVSSLCHQLHYVLETETHLFHWKPPRADISKLKFAVKTVARLRKVTLLSSHHITSLSLSPLTSRLGSQERLRKIKVVSMKHDDDQPLFWEALGGGVAADVREEEDTRERDWEHRYDSATRFYRFDKVRHSHHHT